MHDICNIIDMPQPFTHLFHKVPVLPDLEVITEETGRRYKTPAGLWYPSITTVLGMVSESSLQEWKDLVGEDVAEKRKRDGGLRGDEFHDIMERYLRNEPINPRTLTIDMEMMFKKAKPFVDKIGHIIYLESPLYSDTLELAGRTDCIGTFDGEPGIIDFKTAFKEKKDEYIQGYWMQTAGYSQMLLERTGIDIPRLFLIIAGEDGSCVVKKSYRQLHLDDLRYWRGQYKARHGF